MRFLKKNVSKLGDENSDHMPIGFEVAFPALVEKARSLGLDIFNPENCAVLNEIYAKRTIKLTRIPWDIMHRMPTTLLHSLEGMGAGLDWDKLLKLQSKDGSFLFSPSSTACALIQTKDDKCFKYLEKVVQRFKGGVPNVFPVDMFEHIWVVDRLQRLGISRYFQADIEELMDYVYQYAFHTSLRYWTKHGICWSRNSEVQDIDDTSMGFRLLRLHGYEVSASVFKNFMKNGEFFCFAGQSTNSVTAMYNLHRASQLQFRRGEEILEEARSFSCKFLEEKQASNQLLDKWIITKDLPGEVRYALDIPFCMNLPRLEHRIYIDQYGGDNDVWIGKTLYRMPLVSNNEYLEAAKLDYNNCQSLHRLEWDSIQSWYGEQKFGQFALTHESFLQAYFLAASSIFEPENATQRLAWAKASALVETITFYFSKLPKDTSKEHRKSFIEEFQASFFTRHGDGRAREAIDDSGEMQANSSSHRLMSALLVTINQLSIEVLAAHGNEIRLKLYEAWKKWLRTYEQDEDGNKWEAGLVATTIHLCSNNWTTEMQYHPRYHSLMNITNKVCNQLRHLQKQRGDHMHNIVVKGIDNIEVESSMQELLELVLRKYPDDLDRDTKQTFLTVAKTVYYTAHCSPDTIDTHILKVLFEAVE